MLKAVTVVTVLCVAAGSVLAGCTAKSEDSGGTDTGPSATGLRQALSRVAATDDTRARVGYSDARAPTSTPRVTRCRAGHSPTTRRTVVT